MTIKSITVKAPVNIAVIKYWGKKDEDLIIPINDSISGTLSMDELCATTTIAISHTFDRNQMWLNGDPVPIETNKRLVRVLQLVKQLAGSSCWSDNQFIRVCSRNNFPTAAGLASSAAGYACLVFALSKLFGIEDISKISSLARLGSGSACRSVLGGFVQWVSGDCMETSIARQIIDENAWPEIKVLVLVVSDHRKDTSSTAGMQLSCQTSALIKHRAEKVVPYRIQQMIAAIEQRDFHRFADITMQDSNQFHAICQDTYPPIRYMNDVSWSVVNFIHFYNKFYMRNVAAYTFDAGPNACLYCLESHVSELITLFQLLYPTSTGQPLQVTGINLTSTTAIDPVLVDYANRCSMTDSLKYVISTKIGTGPQIITNQMDEKSLLDPNGMPRQTTST